MFQNKGFHCDRCGKPLLLVSPKDVVMDELTPIHKKCGGVFGPGNSLEDSVVDFLTGKSKPGTLSRILKLIDVEEKDVCPVFLRADGRPLERNGSVTKHADRDS